jgi:hypothetical protein
MSDQARLSCGRARWSGRFSFQDVVCPGCDRSCLSGRPIQSLVAEDRIARGVRHRGTRQEPVVRTLVCRSASAARVLALTGDGTVMLIRARPDGPVHMLDCSGWQVNQ